MFDNEPCNIDRHFVQPVNRNDYMQTITYLHSVLSNDQNKERGIIALATVCILLSIIGLAIVSSAQNIDNFYHMEKVTRNSERKKLALQQTLHTIANQLRDAPSSIVVVNEGIEHTITTLNLRGEKNQKLQQLTISVSRPHEDTLFRAQFLRYPSLLQLPSQAQHNTHDSSITEWLFNRTSNVLQPRFFPEHKQLDSCAKLSAAKVQWVTGDCTIDISINAFNSPSAPQLLVVENGNITILGGTTFYGLILQLTRSSYTYAFHLNANANLNGALVFNKPLDRFISGSLNYSKSTLSTLQDNYALSKMVLIPGSLHDF